MPWRCSRPGIEGPARQAPGGRGDAVEAAVRRAAQLRARCGGRGVRRRHRGAAQAKRPLRRTVRKLETRKAALASLPSFARSGSTRVRACSSSGQDRCRSAVRCRRRSPQGSAKVAAPEGYDQVAARENARLRKGAKTSRNRIETLEVQREASCDRGGAVEGALRPQGEQQDKPGSEHKRGQQRGAPGHGRTQRPGLESAPKRTTRRRMRASAAVRAALCAERRRGIHPREIEVKAYKRVIRRPRWRRTCECASSNGLSAPPVPRLPRTLYGTSFWARFLFEHCACFRPVHRVAAWMSAQLTVCRGRWPTA